MWPTRPFPGTPVPPLKVLITADQFKHICTKINIGRINNLVPYINDICPKYGIVNANIFHEFFANLCEESSEFSRYEENLHYSKPERLMVVWPHRFATIAEAQPYVNNPKGLAMKVYGRRKDLGNITDEDGWDFRGSGPIQITGRSNFTAFSVWMQNKFNIIKSPVDWGITLRTSDEYGMHSACWIFAIAKKLIDEAERDEMKEIVLRINGGYTNMAERIHYYGLAKKYIV